MDPVDRLIAAEWATLDLPHPRRLLVLDAPALVPLAREEADDVVVWCDDLRELSGVPKSLVPEALDPVSIAGVDAVWLRLPRAVQALADTARLVASSADPGVHLVGGGRVKHMTRAMNDALEASFEQVSASLGRQKSRVLHAAVPRPVPAPELARRHHPDLDLELQASGGVFAGTRVDLGTRLLLRHLDEVPAGRVHDLGCGNGTIATLLARDPARRVTASDVSAAAVEATRVTAAANGVRVDVAWADGLASVADRSLDALVTNPPFHVGAAKESAPTLAMFADAARVLRPDGELWCVFNSHLPWRRHLRELVGPTQVVDQDRTFTLTRSRPRPAGPLRWA